MPWMSCIASNVVLASLVGLTAWFVQRRLRRPAVARILWVLVLVKLVTPPLVSVPLVELPGTMACTLGVCGCGPHAGTLSIVGGALPWILLAAWSAGAGATAWTAWRRWTRFQRLLAHGRPAPPPWQSLAAHLASELSIRRPPEILAVPGRLPPLVVPSLGRPRMLLPVGLMRQLNRSQQKALLLHELFHIKRGDHLVRLLELAVTVAFWWLPIVGSIGRRLRACEEACCDAAVVAHLPQARRAYARLLLDVIDFTDPLPRRTVPQATAMSVAEGLEPRLRAILEAREGTRRTWPAAALAMGLACAILPCGMHYDFARRPTATPAAISDNGEAAAGAVRWTGCDPPVELFGCPSFRE